MTGDRPPLPRRDRALLVQLADGALSGRPLERAEARAREIPGAERLIERQRRVARALSGGAAPAFGTVATPAPAPAPAARRRTIAWRAPRLAGAGALAAVIALVAAVALHGGPSTVQRAADLAQLPATQPAPDRAGPVLAADVDGVPFPAWEAEFGWRETGMRRDELDGRPSETVFYEHMGHRIAYTIVSGPRLPRPEGARVIRRDGLEIAVYHDPRHGGHDIAVFERDGRTCVLAGHVLEQSTLFKLAAWRGGGSLRS